MASKYVTMVGQLQWLVTLGRFDLHAQVATMARFRAAPSQGHMDRLKRIYAHATRTEDYAFRFRTDQPDYSFLPEQDFDRTYYVYGNVQEILPDDMPDPLGKAVITTNTMDANFNHCLAPGISLTGCLQFVNKTPVDWYFKKQATVETATNNRNTSKSNGRMLQGSLLMLWMDETRVNNQTKIADDGKLTITLFFNNQTGQNCSYMGNTNVFYFGFNFMSPKWTRTKFMIVISLSLCD